MLYNKMKQDKVKYKAVFNMLDSVQLKPLVDRAVGDGTDWEHHTNCNFPNQYYNRINEELKAAGVDLENQDSDIAEAMINDANWSQVSVLQVGRLYGGQPLGREV